MKTCALCGASSADDAVTCHACGEGTFAPKSVYEFAASVATVVVSEEPVVVADPIKPANYSMNRKGKR